ncbi:unnamed protein product [Boreogadus saida]
MMALSPWVWRGALALERGPGSGEGPGVWRGALGLERGPGSGEGPGAMMALSPWVWRGARGHDGSISLGLERGPGSGEGPGVWRGARGLERGPGSGEGPGVWRGARGLERGPGSGEGPGVWRGARGLERGPGSGEGPWVWRGALALERGPGLWGLSQGLTCSPLSLLVQLIGQGLRRLMDTSTSSDDCGLHEGLNEGKEGEYRLEVVQDAQRLEYWQKDLAHTLVTSISVATVHGHIVAYLGTGDGRHIQLIRAVGRPLSEAQMGSEALLMGSEALLMGSEALLRRGVRRCSDGE